MNASQRSRAISLYRQIYRQAAKFPTTSRVLFVRDRLKLAYREAIEKTIIAEEETIEEHVEKRIQLGELQLETIKVQSEHLAELFKDERVHARF
jgi:23S rRNA pseudoU1915 N3-methylase RlmH